MKAPASRGTGRSLGKAGTGLPLADGTVGRTIRRADLCGALRDEALRRGIAFEHGRRLVDASAGDDGVMAVFEDGTTREADLLVGADGIKSRVRTLIDPAAPPARYIRFPQYYGNPASRHDHPRVFMGGSRRSCPGWR
ncbi:FAD-dependent monooxygenase [Nonomuraea angiospora]|uniref:FAD-dependent oxidoreductase n=1 Tax=Nonomuraea angiospora TaxID=46172 RepID=UPI00344B8479